MGYDPRLSTLGTGFESPQRYKERKDKMVVWEIDKQTGEGNTSVSNIKFVTYGRRKWVHIVGTTLSGGTITNRAGVEFNNIDFSHTFASTDELWKHLLDKTPAGPVFLQLMVNECKGVVNVTKTQQEKRRLQFEAQEEERRRKEGGNKRKPGIVREDETIRGASCSSQIMKPGWFLE
jgi:hypothetical protein